MIYNLNLFGKLIFGIFLGERMTILQKAYNELLVLSNKRVSDLHTLHDFISSAHSELTWLNEKVIMIIF